MEEFIPCTLKELPREMRFEAAERAVAINASANALPHGLIGYLVNICGATLEPEITANRLAVVIKKYWGVGGVDASVQFLDNPPASVRKRILDHANKWSNFGNVRFRETSGTGDIRLARTPGQGYYSYLGPDNQSIPLNQQTMNLDSFSDQTPESEYLRVVPHEFGHYLGFPHEHLRRAIVANIDPAKAITYFGRTQGWTAAEVRAQVLTPIEESQLIGSSRVDGTSIMAYSLPGSIMIDGQPVIGGTDIDATDQEEIGKLYPLVVAPPPPPPPPVNPPPVSKLVWQGQLDAGQYLLSKV